MMLNTPIRDNYSYLISFGGFSLSKDLIISASLKMTTSLAIFVSACVGWAENPTYITWDLLAWATLTAGSKSVSELTRYSRLPLDTLCDHINGYVDVDPFFLQMQVLLPTSFASITIT